MELQHLFLIPGATKQQVDEEGGRKHTSEEHCRLLWMISCARLEASAFRVSMILPQLPEDQAVPGLRYELVPAGALPAFDPSRTIQLLLLNTNQIANFNRLMREQRKFIVLGYWLAVGLRIAAFFSPASHGRWMAVVSPMLQLPATINVVFSFRYGMLVILGQTYEFWFFFAWNLCWLACSCLLFQDLRIAMLPILFVDFQIAALIDAFPGNLRNIVLTSWISVFFIISVMVGIAVDAIDDTRQENILSAGRRTLTTKELIVNALGTILILVIRLGFRKRGLWRAAGLLNARSTQCINFRSKLKMQPKSANGERLARGRKRTFTTENSQSLQLRAKEYEIEIDPKNTCFRFDKLPKKPLSKLSLVLLYYAGVTGLVLAVTAFISSTYSGAHRASGPLPGAMALGSTLFFCCTFACSYQRQLIRHLYSSFDFLFLSMQLTLGHICTCDAFNWRWSYCSSVMCSWIWMHWILSLDALTPVCKRNLGFKLQYAGPVVVLFMVGQICLVIEILVWNAFDLKDRQVFQSEVGGHRIQFSVVPFLLSRVVTIFIWCCRLLWQLWHRQDEDELLILRGDVEFDSQVPRKAAQHVRSSPTENAVADSSMSSLSSSSGGS